MPVHPKSAAAGGVAGIAMAMTLLMGGCVSPPEIEPIPAVTADAPVFASDDEALAAAEEAYAAYLAMSDLIAQEGGKNPERIAPFVTVDQFAIELEGYELYAANGWMIEGGSEFFGALLQSRRESDVVIYVCEDISGVNLVDRTGVLIRSNLEEPPVGLEVVFLMPDFVLDRAEPVEGLENCAI